MVCRSSRCIPTDLAAKSWAPNSVGLDTVLVRAQSVSEMQDRVRRLVEDAELRARVGDRTRSEILATNTGESWRRAIHNMYEQAFSLPPREEMPPGVEKPRFDDIDLFSTFVFGTPIAHTSPAGRLAAATEVDLRILPIKWRLKAWARMAWRGEFNYRRSTDAWRYLLPEWLSSRLSMLRPTWSWRI